MLVHISILGAFEKLIIVKLIWPAFDNHNPEIPPI
jgi:hypothetical protein